MSVTWFETDAFEKWYNREVRNQAFIGVCREAWNAACYHLERELDQRGLASVDTNKGTSLPFKSFRQLILENTSREKKNETGD